MSHYVIVADQKKGKLGISNYVFEQIAIEVIEELAQNELKDKLILTYKKKKYRVTSSIDLKGKLTINCYIFFSSDSEVQEHSKLIQERIYSAINSQTELNSFNINISIGAIINK